MKKLLLVLFALSALAGCENDATVASRNLSTAADMFELERRIVFYNGITDTYMLVIEGRCSIKADTTGGKLDVVCRVGKDEFKKHFLGLSDNVTYFVEQLEASKQDVFHYRVIFKPQAILPNIDLETSLRPEK